MATLFIGKTGTRMRFNKQAFGALAAANSQATSILLAFLNQCSHVAYFVNGLNTDCAIWGVPPDVDSSVTTNRFLLFEMAPGQIINFENSLLEFDPGTQLFVSYVGGSAPTSGNVKISWWG